MFFDFSQKSTLLLIFFFHGAVFTILLFIQGVKHERRSSLWLALFILLCCFYIAPFMFGYAGWYGMQGYRQFLFYTPIQQLFLLGPVLYFYVQSLLNPDFRLTRRNYLHFLPALAYLIYSFIIFIADLFVLEHVYFYADGRDKDFATWYQVTGLISMFVYFTLSLRHYQRYKKFAFQVVSFAESILYRWIERYLAALLIILLLRVLFFALNPEWGQFGSKFWYYFCFSGLFYYISITGYTRAVQIISASSVSSLKPINVASINSLREMGLESENLRPHTIGSQPIAELQSWKDRLEKLMRANQLYTNSTLTLIDISEALNTTPKQVSQIVNQGFQMNFNDYVNNHRTQAVIEKLKAGEQKVKTLLALALECGFNSKSTFNRAFKKHTGMTPKDFLEKAVK